MTSSVAYGQPQNTAERVDSPSVAAGTSADADARALVSSVADAAARLAGAEGVRLASTPIPNPDAAALRRAGFQFANQRDELRCLAEAVYFEARGESRQGQMAVAEVVMNRVAHPRFPKSVCGVVYQGASRRACQFSWACDGRPDTPRGGAWEQAQRIAAQALSAEAPRLTDGATHFHALRVRPAWARVYTRTAQIGNHLFFRHVPPSQRGRALAASDGRSPG